LYEFKSRIKVTDFKALSNTSFLDAYLNFCRFDN